MSETLMLVFAATEQAMQAEAVCTESGIGGALVLKPKGMLGNCGLALQVGAEHSARLLSLLAERHIVPAGVYAALDPERWEIMDSE